MKLNIQKIDGLDDGANNAGFTWDAVPDVCDYAWEIFKHGGEVVANNDANGGAPYAYFRAEPGERYGIRITPLFAIEDNGAEFDF